MFGSRAAVAALLAVVAMSASFSGSAAAKPKVETKDAAAARMEQKALRAYVAGDLSAAIGGLEQALRKCEPPFGCTPATKAHLHISLGTVRGVGEGDYAAAKKEFVAALTLDPKAHLRTVSTPELTAAFEDARREVSGTPPEGPEPAAPERTPPEK
ncbi:MAG TPA: hypothetical protein VM925_16510, partial [Labilithrix sp.]|nr:hypothetical protein [Labilithrix sp.]